MGGRAGGGASAGMGSRSRGSVSLPQSIDAKETKAALKSLQNNVTFPLSLNSEMALTAYHEYDYHKIVKDNVKSVEIKEGLFKQIDKTSLSSYKKGELKKMIEKTVSTKGYENVVVW